SLTQSRRWATELSLISEFFFSSRRRHTRSKRDWSSDVCSSDLWYSLPDHLCWFGVRAVHELTRGFSRQHRITEFPTTGMHQVSRSEERRVGKECRARV